MEATGRDLVLPVPITLIVIRIAVYVERGEGGRGSDRERVRDSVLYDIV